MVADDDWEVVCELVTVDDWVEDAVEDNEVVAVEETLDVAVVVNEDNEQARNLPDW